MVADKGFKAMENHGLSGPKSALGSLQEVVVYEKLLL